MFLAECAALAEAEAELDQHLAILSEAARVVSSHPAHAARLYVSDDEITALPAFAGQTLFAIRAPSQKSTLNLPLPLDSPEGSSAQQIFRRVLFILQPPCQHAVEHETCLYAF